MDFIRFCLDDVSACVCSIVSTDMNYDMFALEKIFHQAAIRVLNECSLVSCQVGCWETIQGLSVRHLQGIWQARIQLPSWRELVRLTRTTDSINKKLVRFLNHV